MAMGAISLKFGWMARCYPSGCLVDVNIVGRDGDSLVGRAQQGESKAYELVQETKRRAQQIDQESI